MPSSSVIAPVLIAGVLLACHASSDTVSLVPAPTRGPAGRRDPTARPNDVAATSGSVGKWSLWVGSTHLRGANVYQFRHGPDPDNHADVESSALMDVITDYWGRNTIRPSSFVAFTPVVTIHLPIVLKNNAVWGEPVALSEVGYWAYQLQDLSAPGAVDALISSRYDMLVLEPTRTDWSSDDRTFDTRGTVARLKGSPAHDGAQRKLVIAYADIGEAEDWRWYWTWSKDWDCTGDPPADWPDYILACDPDGWSGNYPVAYWDPRWKDIVIYGENQSSAPYGDYTSVIDEVLKDGLDGVYLDWVEAYEDETVVAAALAAGKDPAAEMVAFIQEIRDYATARNPDFVVIQQNAAALGDERPELFGIIDGIAQEAVWYDGDATDDWNDPGGCDREQPASLSDYYVGHLQAYLNADLPVFNCEYALAHASAAYASSYGEGYIPYVSRCALSRLTTTVPPGY